MDVGDTWSGHQVVIFVYSFQSALPTVLYYLTTFYKVCSCLTGGIYICPTSDPREGVGINGREG